MKTSIATLARASVRKLQPYRSARSLTSEGRVFLDANELCEAPFLNSGLKCEADLNRYPLPQPPALLRAFSELYNVSPDRILVGRGSDEAIDLLTRVFCEPKEDEILITPPTYGMYEVSAAIQDVNVKAIPLLLTDKLITDNCDWSLDVQEIKQYLKVGKPKLAYICSPNNPTGTAFPAHLLREILEAAENSLVVVDEAYGEFSNEESATYLLDDYANLVVLRTLSKAWGLAGLRCGVALGNPEVIELLQKVRAPYPLPRPVADLALEAVQARGREAMRKKVAGVLTERQRLVAQLRELPVVETIYSSNTNFLLVKFIDEAAIMRATAASGIIVRSRNSELKNCVRITVGSSEENNLLLQILSKVAHS